MQHEYLLIFAGLILGGETVLLPAIYLALIGKLNLMFLVTIAGCATIIADSGWYLVGRLSPVYKLNRLPRGRWGQRFSRAAELFRRHGLKVVFCSKFIYGTRIATQLLAGMTRLRFLRYLAVNSASVLTWLGFLVLISLLLRTGTGVVNSRAHRAVLLLVLFVPAVFAWRWAANHVVSRLLSLPVQPPPNPKDIPAKCVSAIVPAFNEAETVADVVHALEAHPAIDDIIVVDDGSSDGTAARVRATSARLISLGANQGKATAMAKGVECARHEIIFFLDADLRGLTQEVIDALVTPVLAGEFDMFAAIRDRRQLLLNKIVYFAPILGGERVLKRRLWEQVPSWCVRSFQIEIALNYFSKRAGGRMGFSLMPGLMHIKKETKRGFWPGVRARASMYAELVSISFRLYFLRSFAMLFRKLMPHNARRHPACAPPGEIVPNLRD